MGKSTERAPPSRRQQATHREHYLFVLVEGARPDAGSMRISLRGLDVLQLRRGEERALRGDALEIPDTRMSACHARIVRSDAGFVVEDTGSTNGTSVNGAPIATHVLRDGDLVELGQTCLLYREIEGTGEPARSVDAAQLLGREAGFATFDPNLARSLDRLARVAPSPLSILLLGETGTGKEVLARALHAQSQRPGPFVPVNCGAIPQNLVESQLFGHVRGAFSGAIRDEPGLIRSAHGGTLFLDEIGDLPPASQAALLRVLQEGEVRPVGSVSTVAVDIRVIAATHMPLEELVEKNAFRRDLYARLAGYTFTLLPLRERLVDLGLIVSAMLRAGKLGARRDVRIQPDAIRVMLRYDWPLNMRELEQCVGAACVLAEDETITTAELPPRLGDVPGADRDPDQRTQIVALISKHNGNLSAVAREMRTSRSQLYRLMFRYGIDEKT